MLRVTSHKAVKGLFAILSVLVLYVHSGGYLLHAHHTGAKANAHGTQVQAPCSLCAIQGTPLTPVQCGPALPTVLERGLTLFFPPFKQIGYTMPEFAANPKSPPFVA